VGFSLQSLTRAAVIQKHPDAINIRVLHIHYLAWRLPICGPQGWSLAAAKNACGSWGLL